MLYKNLYERQLNVGKTLSSKYYQNQIIKSYFESSKNLHLFKKSIKRKTNNIFFSDDGNYLATDFKVWKINEETFFPKLTGVIKAKGFYETIALGFNEDSSKFFLKTFRFRRDFRDFESIISIIDLNIEKIVNSITSIENPIKLSCSPTNANLFSYGCESGSIYLCDLKKPKPALIYKTKKSINSLQYHSDQDHLILVASNDKNGLFLLDLRNHKPVFQYEISYFHNTYIDYAKFNRKGNQIFVIINESNPVLFNVNETLPAFEFHETSYINSKEFYNFDKKKNCIFAGPYDEYVVTTSNNGEIYMWEIPKFKLNKKEDNQVIEKVNKAKFILEQETSSLLDYNYKSSILVCLVDNFLLNFYSPLAFQPIFKTPF